MTPFTLTTGNIPLLISVPHNSSEIPDQLAQQLTDVGRSSIDTDWYLDRLYDFAEELGASLLLPAYSRYVVDLNRSLADESLYPGQTTTGLFPTETFDGEPLFQEPRDDDENSRWIESLWRPYHGAIREELNRLRQDFESVVLLEAHSIASHAPRLFDGQLPDFNIGTNLGATCDDSLANALTTSLSQAHQYSTVLNGRFVGGYITRHFGDPTNGFHAVQLELSQRTYLQESARCWSDEKVAEVKPVLKAFVQSIVDWLI